MVARKWLLGLVACTGLAVPSAAQDSGSDVSAESAARTPTPLEETAEDPVDDESVVCRNLAPKVGTRLPGRRVCLTVALWRQWEEDTKELMRDTERQGLVRNSPG